MSVTVSPGVEMSSRGRRGRTQVGGYGPERPVSQRMGALARANEIRLARAALKHRIARGEVTAAEVILECPDCASSWPIGDLLMSQWRWGATRMRKFLSRSHVLESKPAGSLTMRQRRMLATMLGAAGEPSEPEPPAEVQAVVDYLTVPL